MKLQKEIQHCRVRSRPMRILDFIGQTHSPYKLQENGLPFLYRHWFVVDSVSGWVQRRVLRTLWSMMIYRGRNHHLSRNAPVQHIHHHHHHHHLHQCQQDQHCHYQHIDTHSISGTTCTANPSGTLAAHRLTESMALVVPDTAQGVTDSAVHVVHSASNRFTYSPQAAHNVDQHNFSESKLVLGAKELAQLELDVSKGALSGSNTVNLHSHSFESHVTPVTSTGVADRSSVKAVEFEDGTGWC